MFNTDISHKFLCKKAYSSAVERIAHNGLVVGSIPTEPILLLYILKLLTTMELNFKNHKITKTKMYLKKSSLFFLFDGVYRKSNN